MFTFKATITRTIDGDSVVPEIQLGFGLRIDGDESTAKHHLRLYGINAPETRYRKSGLTDEEWEAEKVAGAASGKALAAELDNKTVFVSTLKPDKYGGRWQAVIYLSLEDLHLEEKAMASQPVDLDLLEIARKKSVNYWMMEQGFAAPYKGDSQWIFHPGK